MILRSARPISEFRLAETSPAVEALRARTWRIETPGARLVHGRIQLDHPARSVAIRVSPDPGEQDRFYPGLVVVGGGYVVYTPYYQVSGGLPTLIAGTAAPKEAFLYIGPPRQRMTEAGASFISGPETPAWIKPAIRSQLFKGSELYARALGVKPARMPVVIVTAHAGSGPNSLRADVVGNVIFARLQLGKDQGPDPEMLKRLGRLILHEVFHLWNAGLYDSTDGETQPWLHEGGAEYASIVAAVATGLVGDDEARDQLASNLSQCRSAIADKGLIEANVRSGRAVYSCGVAVQFLADLQARSTGSDFFGLWRDMFRASRAGGGHYTSGDFLSEVAGGGPALRALLAGGADRWPAFDAGATQLGLKLARAPDATAYRAAILFPVLRAHCTQGSFGFETLSDRLRLDDNPACGPLAGAPEVTGVEGHSLMTDAGPAYAAAAEICARGGDLRFNVVGGGSRVAACSKALPPAAESYRIVEAPSIALGW